MTNLGSQLVTLIPKFVMDFTASRPEIDEAVVHEPPTKKAKR
jgi:hypothetical protein